MTIGLWLFIIVHVLNFLGLLLDYVLYQLEFATITYIVEHNRWIGIPILGLQFLSLLGLAEHFYGSD